MLLITFSIASFLQGLVGTFIRLIILRLIMGLVEGPTSPLTQSGLARESSPHRRGFNLGFTMNTANGLFGAVLAPIVIIALANFFDWRTAIWGFVVPAISDRPYRKPRRRVLRPEVLPGTAVHRVL